MNNFAAAREQAREREEQKGPSAADRVTALEQAMGINYDGAVRGLMPRLKNIELEILGEFSSGKIGDRLDELEQVV